MDDGAAWADAVIHWRPRTRQVGHSLQVPNDDARFHTSRVTHWSLRNLLAGRAVPPRRIVEHAAIIPRTSLEKRELGSPPKFRAASSSPSRPSTAPGSTSSRGSSPSSPARSYATSAWHQNRSSRSASSPASRISNRYPVIHTWSYKLAEAACYDSNQENADLVVEARRSPAESAQKPLYG
jgi:hypothetical protein